MNTTLNKEVFDRLIKNLLKLKAEKCQSLKKVSYLRHVISEKGVFPEQATTRVIEEYPTPEREIT